MTLIVNPNLFATSTVVKKSATVQIDGLGGQLAFMDNANEAL
jgi:acyl-CoA hydrolase